MSRVHVFEIIGEIILRPSGNAGFPPVPCKVIRTRCWRQPDGTVMFNELTTGHDHYHFSTWFKDWSARDNFNGDDFQSGRPVDVAIPVVVYDQLVGTGEPVMRSTILGGTARRSGFFARIARPDDLVQAPIAAVKIDGRWEFPLPPR